MSFRAADFAILEPVKNVKYGDEDLCSTRDIRIRDLLLDVEDGTFFEQVKKMIPRDADRVLNAFAERAASIAVRHQEARYLRVGLLAAAIAIAISGDPRDVFPALALLHRASEMIGHDPNLEFSAIYNLSGGCARSLIDFLRRAPEDKSIAAMGYEEGDDKRGFKFIRNW